MKVGFVGLGIMGRPMCKNLVKAGHELVVFDFNMAEGTVERRMSEKIGLNLIAFDF